MISKDKLHNLHSFCLTVFVETARQLSGKGVSVKVPNALALSTCPEVFGKNIE